MTVINMALFFERFVKTTMSAFFILHQFLGTVQQTVGGNDGSNSNSESGEGIDNTHELLFGSLLVLSMSMFNRRLIGTLKKFLGLTKLFS